MVTARPQEPEWLSWIWVIAGAAAIYLTVPFARALQKFIAGEDGETVFTYIVVAVVLAGLAVTILLLRRLPARNAGHYAWIAGVAIAFLLYASQLQLNPIEALHLIEYGLLGLVIFRALAHRCSDLLIYPLAVVVGALVGTVDEIIQWLTPKRFFGFEDIWLDAAAVALIQVGIAKGLTPVYIKGLPDRRSVGRFAVWGIVFTILFGATTQLTPKFIHHVAVAVPTLAWLDRNPNQVIEYGFRYEDAAAGTFRSRLSPDVLSAEDRQRSRDAAAIINRFPNREDYRAFLSEYPPYPDAFVHELRVHLFRRDRYWFAANAPDTPADDKLAYASVARQEQLILEGYFPNSLAASGFRLPDAERERLHAAAPVDPSYDSKVSQTVVTRLSQMQMLVCWLLLGAVLLVLAIRGYRAPSAR